MSLSRLLLFPLILQCATLTFCKRISGVYIDNGLNQTVRLEVLTQRGAINLERQMLEILELPKKPRLRQGISSTSPMKRSAHMFLMDAYKLFEEDEAGNPTGFFNISRKNLRIMRKSDIIVTFAAQNHKAPDVIKTDQVNRLWFDVSRVSPEDEIINAELRIYYRIEKIQNKRNSGPVTIEVFRVLTARADDGNRKLIFVQSVNTTKKEGWVTFNVTKSLQHWVYNSGVNRGLYLAVYAPDSRDQVIRSEETGIVGFMGDPEKRPFMVGYFRRTKPRRNKNIELPYSRQINFFEEIKYQRKPTPCKREKMYVNFAELNWDTWIFAPQGFDAYYCYGECSFPFPNLVPTTNHAIIQALVNLRVNASIPKACCVPTELADVKVVYKLDDEVFTLKKYQDMSVKGCGCQ